MFRRKMMALALAVLSIPFFAVASGSPQAQVPNTGAQQGQKTQAQSSKGDTLKAHTPKGHRVFQMWMYNSDHSHHDALNKHFREHACRLYKKHGIELVGFWTVQDANFINQIQKQHTNQVPNRPQIQGQDHTANQSQSHAANQSQSHPTNQGQRHPTNQAVKQPQNDRLFALLAFPSWEAAAASWKALNADPEWSKAEQMSFQQHLLNFSERFDIEATDYSPMW
jgi:hypothetical protein